MANEHIMRASDADRDHVVETLRGQYAEGRLTLEEFDERTSAALTARTWTDLRQLTSDLPVGLAFDPPPALPVPAQIAPAPGPVAPRAWRLVSVLPIVLFVAVVSAGVHHRGEHPLVFFFPVLPLAIIIGGVFAMRWVISRR